MKTHTEIASAVSRHPTVHEAEEVAVWSIGIEAGSDPLLVPRILQKLAVPDIELLGLNFSSGNTVSYARVHVRCRGALVRLVAKKLRQLVMVREARVE